ncbi:MAG: chalcone isomerase family protein [Rickettsiales bacterium]
MKIRHAAVLLVAAFIATGASAADKPPELAAIHAKSPCGEGSLHKFFFHVYDATLWKDAGPLDYRTPFALSLVYGIDATKEDLADNTISELEKIHGRYAPEQEASLRQRYAASFADVREGDRLTALYEPKRGAAMYQNGKLLSRLPPDLAKPFLDIWVSEKTSEPELRRALLRCVT